MGENEQSEFERAAETESQIGWLQEFVDFLKTNKKWWLLPMLIMFLLFAALLYLSSSAAAPFIYTVF